MSETVLAAVGIEKEFGADRIVEGANIELHEGEILALLGPNGVGKTVLLSCLAGSQRPTEGAVALRDGTDDSHVGHHLAFMHQDSVAVDTLTGRENAEYYSRLHPHFTDRWEPYVERLGIAEDLDKRVEHYSGGMVRKLEFALTMSVDVPIYVLDEPTAGVDLSMVRRFHDIVLERNEAGASFVVSSHRPMDADLADRLAFMPDGRVSAVGTPDDLLADVPSVVRVTGTDAMETAERFVVGDRLFPLGGEARGFLRDDASVADLRDAIGDGSVERLDPTYADLFNYEVHVKDHDGDGG